MAGQPHIVGLGGSLAERSTSLAALRLALAGAEKEGATTEVFSIRDLDLPLYETDLPAPAQVDKLCDAIERCQRMIWSSPLYHGSVRSSPSARSAASSTS